MKILVIAAHMDDEVLGVGGTISKLAYENEVYVLILTDSCSAQYLGQDVSKIIKEKEKCAIEANKILGVKQVFFANLPDMKLDILPHIEINQAIENIIGDIKPQVVFTHHFSDVNLDHQKVYESTMVATRPTEHTSVKKVYTYEVLSSTEWQSSDSRHIFIPNTYFDITEDIEKKCQALEVYSQEIRKYPHPRSVEAIRNLAMYRGQSVGLFFAEAFNLVRDVRKDNKL